MVRDVAVVGAGPYGLSIGAHLLEAGVDTAVLGKPMDTWREHMPSDMLLKSDGFASSLDAPVDGWRLGDYCARTDLPYGDLEPRVPLRTLVDYGTAFQSALVPTLDTRSLARLSRQDGHFSLTLDDGDELAAHRVVLAVGITHFAHVPEKLRPAGPRLTHSSDHRTFDELAGKRVAVVGGGSSAVEVAAALVDVGAEVTIVARRPEMHFWPAPDPSAGPPTLRQRLRSPSSGLGPGWRQRACEDLPDVFRMMPAGLRLKVVREFLGPSAGWWLTDKVTSSTTILTSTRVRDVRLDGEKVVLDLTHDTSEDELCVDHVIAATGYRADLDRLPFLDEQIRSATRRVGAMPALSRTFESSVPGLHYVGNAAAGTFGPLMRFMVGAEFAAPRVANHLRRTARRV